MSTPKYGLLLKKLDSTQRKTIRSLENNRKKLIKNRYSISFNKTCINESILPKYSDIKIHEPAVRKAKFSKEYRLKLVKYQLRKKEKLQESLIKKKLKKYVERLKVMTLKSN